jgi:hypothetical protein
MCPVSTLCCAPCGRRSCPRRPWRTPHVRQDQTHGHIRQRSLLSRDPGPIDRTYALFVESVVACAGVRASVTVSCVFGRRPSGAASGEPIGASARARGFAHGHRTVGTCHMYRVCTTARLRRGEHEWRRATAPCSLLGLLVHLEGSVCSVHGSDSVAV